MRCISLSPPLRYTRYKCAVSPALAPSRIVARCAEISKLTHLLSHISKRSPSVDNPLRRLFVLTKYDAPVCRPRFAACATSAQRLQHSHPRALSLCAEISNLTHLSSHVSKYSALASN